MAGIVSLDNVFLVGFSLFPRLGTMIVIQFGFCTLFVTSFPVAPAFALINNWIDIRMEAFRLLTQYRRPIAYRAQDIGIFISLVMLLESYLVQLLIYVEIGRAHV